MASRNIPVQQMTVGAYIRSLATAHGIMILSQVAFAIVLATRVRTMSARYHLQNPWFFIVLGLAFVSIAGAHYLFRPKLERAREQTTMAGKLSAYRSAFIFRNTFPNAIGIVSTVLYCLSKESDFLAVTGMIVLVYVVWWPYRAKIAGELELGNGLDDPHMVIGDA